MFFQKNTHTHTKRRIERDLNLYGEATSVQVIKLLNRNRAEVRFFPTLTLPLFHLLPFSLCLSCVSLSDFLPAWLFILRAVCLCLAQTDRVSRRHAHTHTGQKQLYGQVLWTGSKASRSILQQLPSRELGRKKAPNRTVSLLILAINQTCLCVPSIWVCVCVCACYHLPTY